MPIDASKFSDSERMTKLSGSALHAEPRWLRCSAHRSSRSTKGLAVPLEPGTSLLSWRGTEGWADGARNISRSETFERDGAFQLICSESSSGVIYIWIHHISCSQGQMLGEFCLKVFGRLSALPVPEGRSVSPSKSIGLCLTPRG